MFRKFLIFVWTFSLSFPVIGFEVAKSLALNFTTLGVLIWFILGLTKQSVVSYFGLILIVISSVNLLWVGEMSFNDFAAIVLFVSCLVSWDFYDKYESYIKKLHIIFLGLNILLVLSYVLDAYAGRNFLAIISSVPVPHNKHLFYFRPQNFFPEPSYLGLYLAISFRLLSSPTLKVLTVISLVMVGSLLGILVLCFLLVSTMDLRRIIVIGLITLVVIVAFDGSIYFSRIFKLLNAIRLGDISSSEGSRGNSILVLFDFLRNGSSTELFFGVPWSGTVEWIKQQYPNAPIFSSLHRGFLDNMLSALVLKVGFLGSIISVAILFVNKASLRFSARSVFYLLMFTFFTGMLLYPFVWYLMFLFLPSSNEKGIIRS